MRAASTFRRQRGISIVLVMLIVALAAIIASYMATQQDFWQRQTESLFEHEEARRISIAAVDWARAVLADDAQSNNTDNANELWTTQLPAMTVENGEISGIIEDRQGRFNLNNLVANGATSPADVAQYKRLLDLLGLPEELAATLADWMDTDSETQAGGAEDEYYLSLPNPYRAANQPLTEVNELLLVKGYTPAVIERLRPFVAALPSRGPVNVNFAAPEVLSAIAANLSLTDARTLVESRGERPFSSAADFMQRLPSPSVQVPQDMISVSSEYFMVTGWARFGESQVITQALLQRMAGWPFVVWQSVQ